MRRSAFVGIAIVVAIGAFAFRFFFKPHHDQDEHQTLRLFTAEELALHNGTDDKLPILLGILGNAEALVQNAIMPSKTVSDKWTHPAKE